MSREKHVQECLRLCPKKIEECQSINVKIMIFSIHKWWLMQENLSQLGSNGINMLIM